MKGLVSLEKNYEDLSPQDERELVLWLTFLEGSVNNAHVQMKRWRQLNDGWDLQMFFVAVVHIDDAAENLKRFLTYDSEIWDILKRFRKQVERHKLRDLRNDLVHPGKVFKLQDKKGIPLPERPLLILGGYHMDKDEYTFGTHTVKISEIFGLVQTTTQEIRAVFKNRLMGFYEAKNLRGMIPFTHLHKFGVETPQPQYSLTS